MQIFLASDIIKTILTLKRLICTWENEAIKYEDRELEANEKKFALQNVILPLIKDIKNLDLKDLEGRLQRMQTQLWGIHKLSVGIHALQELQTEIWHQFSKHIFVYIQTDLSEFFQKTKLFGEEVYNAFPSAREEITAAGSCLACEFYTATIFHLMRTAEVGLRCLARDRRVKVPKKPLEYAEWHHIIEGLDKKIKPLANKKRGPKKDAALDFYRGSIGELEAFKQIWRNQVMHTRGTYDKYQALSAMHHVKSFMQRLSVRISEDRKKPVAWGI